MVGCLFFGSLASFPGAVAVRIAVVVAVRAIYIRLVVLLVLLVCIICASYGWLLVVGCCWCCFPKTHGHKDRLRVTGRHWLVCLTQYVVELTTFSITTLSRLGMI